MATRARIDIDVVFQQGDASTITVGSLTEHLSPTLSSATQINGSVGTAAVTITGPTPVSTIVVKAGAGGTLRVNGAMELSAGRLAVFPVTASITLSAPSGAGTYSCIWAG
jgi:hypothetical protein